MRDLSQTFRRLGYEIWNEEGARISRVAFGVHRVFVTRDDGSARWIGDVLSNLQTLRYAVYIVEHVRHPHPRCNMCGHDRGAHPVVKGHWTGIKYLTLWGAASALLRATPA